ncbi:hypothetical protein KZ350_04940 [Glaesserella parasuis]|nr:hypothetical protein [Glaesserella parasuis]
MSFAPNKNHKVLGTNAIFKPNADDIFAMVSKRGLLAPDKVLYKLSRGNPVSFDAV